MSTLKEPALPLTGSREQTVKAKGFAPKRWLCLGPLRCRPYSLA